MMKRKPLGCLTIGGLIAFVAALLIVSGSYAMNRAKMFSPGTLSAQTGAVNIGGITSHQELEENCAACHPAPWDRQGMGDLCLACHQEIQAEMTVSSAMHGAIAATFDGTSCQSCHTEHQGAEANITNYLGDDFPHDLVGFSLNAHDEAQSMQLICRDCHASGFTSFAVSVCQNCHTDLDQAYSEAHAALFGRACLECHDGVDTYGARFDHNETYQLVGLHQQVECVECHAGAESLAMLQATSQECVDCHSAQDAHDGSLGQQCENCHSPQGWTPANFDHSSTGFQLVGGHEDVVCADCHVDVSFSTASPLCASCHLDDDPHNAAFGQACESCHLVTAWLDVTFDHTGEFAGLCQSCHLQDAPAQHYPGQCSACHSTNAWEPASFDHQVAGATDCQSCHTGDKPANHYGGQCSACHSTNAWEPASFDHQVAGATDCLACHTGDRPANHFTGQCSTCHSTNAWEPASFSHTFPLNHGGANENCDLCHTNQNYTAYTCYGCHEHTQSNIREEHDDVSNIDNCVRCHWDGREHEDEGDDDDD
jgi:hypothetical protein